MGDFSSCHVQLTYSVYGTLVFLLCSKGRKMAVSIPRLSPIWSIHPHTSEWPISSLDLGFHPNAIFSERPSPRPPLKRASPGICSTFHCYPSSSTCPHLIAKYKCLFSPTSRSPRKAGPGFCGPQLSLDRGGASNVCWLHTCCPRSVRMSSCGLTLLPQRCFSQGGC